MGSMGVGKSTLTNAVISGVDSMEEDEDTEYNYLDNLDLLKTAIEEDKLKDTIETAK